MIYVKINNIEYPAYISGKFQNAAWDGRESKTINVKMDYSTATGLFVDDCSWSIITEDTIDDQIVRTEYDNSEFNIAGQITDYRDGMLDITMGKETPLEKAYRLLYGGDEE